MKIINKKYFLFKLFFYILTILAMALVYMLLLFILYKGFSSISLESIFSDANILNALMLKERVFDGIFPAIVGTLMLIGLSLSFGIVFGLASGIYLSIYANKKVKDFLNTCFELLATVPSIIIGFFFFCLVYICIRLFWIIFYPHFCFLV